MRLFFRLVFLLLLVGAIAGVVASIMSKKKLESMTDDEIREYLGLKLAGKVGDEQLATIQDAVISGVRGKQPTVDHYIEDVEEAIEELDHVGEEAADEGVEELEVVVETVEESETVPAE